MGSERVSSPENKNKITDTITSESATIIQWEDLQQELVRLWSLSSALNKAKEMKTDLSQNLESLIQVRVESLRRSNELAEMREKLEARKLAMGNLLIQSKSASEEVQRRKEQLILVTRPLLHSSKALSMAFRQLQEAKRLLAGEMGHVHLKKLHNMLRRRQQYMITQVSALYPLKTSTGEASGTKLDSSSSTTGGVVGSSSSIAPKSTNPGTALLTILGLQLSAPPLRKMSFFSDKQEAQRSATALGYVAHVVLLIASYLDVPLRYPLRLGGSRSYIHDLAPSFESTSLDLTSSSAVGSNPKPMEFPLFLEGQDTTRAAYAIFLLNKDLEQLLNFIGVQSLGPRHVLANLKELMRIIQSPDFIDK